MKHNPQIMMQMLTMFDVKKMTENSLDTGFNNHYEFFNRRPRYTEKILAQIYRGLPGLMGSMEQTAFDQQRTLDANFRSQWNLIQQNKGNLVSKEQKTLSYLNNNGGWASYEPSSS